MFDYTADADDTGEFALANTPGIWRTRWRVIRFNHAIDTLFRDTVITLNRIISFTGINTAVSRRSAVGTSRAPIGQSNPAILTSVRALKARIRLPTISISNRVDTILTR